VSSKSRSKGQSGGRTTPPSRNQSRTSGGRVTPSRKATPKSEPKAAPKERTPGLNVAAVDRLVARVNKAIPKGRVRSAFSGTSGLSPNTVTVLGTVPAIVVVAISVSAKTPLLLVVAILVMAASILALMRFVNKTCVVAELPTELVGFTNRRGTLEPRFRVPHELTVLPSLDPRWLKVEVGGDRLWVSKRTFGLVVERLAVSGDADGEAEADDEAGG
jgi:hypothetical protein